MSLVKIVFDYSNRIHNNRTIETIFDHAYSEVKELEAEIALGDTGEDGIVGEAIDVIQCMLDIIHKHNPACTEEYLENLMLQKCEKWQRIYG